MIERLRARLTCLRHGHDKESPHVGYVCCRRCGWRDYPWV